jgi:hypothetical protein
MAQQLMMCLFCGGHYYPEMLGFVRLFLCAARPCFVAASVMVEDFFGYDS